MKRSLSALLALAVMLASVAPAAAETTLEKIARTGTLTIGTRTGSPPFAYVNKQNEWVGFSIDLVDQLVLSAVSTKVGKPVKLEKKESTPATRIPLLSSGAVDLIAGTMTDTRPRRDSADFSLTFFVTGAQFMVKKGSPIRGIQDIAGKRVGAQQGSTNARIIRERVPSAQLREFPDQPSAFQALAQGQVDTYTNDGIQLAGLRTKAPNPGEWDIVGDFYSYEPYGMAMRKGDSDFRAAVNNGLMEGIDSGKFFEIYEKWFGPRGELPYPMTPDIKKFMIYQSVPK
ncbi:MAG TPA: transporter substrate-binding domain-containing protein [Candidatus Methylomirabilis sp.]|jgi:ABC-type amino acid transport substrate-binding protein|nr:transporter substrate-binding domain-containing protein [Candidatus Methylomirabilis sp.]